MKQRHWKWVSRAAPRKARRGGSDPPGKHRGIRPLWLNSEAVDVAEHCAETVGVSVARFVESMLFDVCGAPQRPKKSADGTSRREARAPAQIIRIDRGRRP